MTIDTNGNDKGFRFTGWHMLGVMFLFFGTIITVNMIMAWNAVSSWSGLVVQNTYVASQQFNGKAEAAKRRAATGIKGSLSVNGENVMYQVYHPSDAAYRPDSVVLNFKRPVGETQNFELTLSPTADGKYMAVHSVPAGQWIVESIVTHSGEVVIHEGERVTVRQNEQ